MKTFITTFLILCTLTACSQGTQNGNNKQLLTWGGKATVGSYAPEGTLEVKSIDAQVNGNNLESLEVTIDMKSLNQENKRLTKHLSDKDFFHVKKYPEARFVLTQPFTIGNDTTITGQMTIKDKTQTETIPVTASVSDGILLLTIDHKMNRLDYGITYNSPSVFEKLKENAIADTITLKGTLKIAIE